MRRDVEAGEDKRNAANPGGKPVRKSPDACAVDDSAVRRTVHAKLGRPTHQWPRVLAPGSTPLPRPVSFTGRPRLLAGLTAACLFAAGLALSLAAANATWRDARAHVEARFAGHADRLETEVARRIGQTAYGLRGVRALVAAQGTLDRQSFRTYVGARDLGRELPGLRGLGFIERVPRDRLDAFVQAERADDAPGFNVRVQWQQR